MSLIDIKTNIKESNVLKVFLAISLVTIWFNLDYNIVQYYLVYIIEPLHLESFFVIIYRLSSILLFLILLLFFKWYSKNIDEIKYGKVFSKKTIAPFILTVLLVMILITYFKFSDNIISREYVIFDEGSANLLLFIITFIINPIIYEVIFRGIIFSAVKNKSKVIIWLLSVFPFVLFHVYTMANVFSLSIWIRTIMYNYELILILILISCILTFSRIKSEGVLLPVVLNSIFFISYFNILF